MNIRSEQWQNTLVSLSKSFDLPIDQDQSVQLANYASELIDTNKKVNLTAITDPKEIAEKHIIDSFILAKFFPVNASVLDLGTGGGFPGIPLKIYLPSLTVTLADSSRKKINFLKYVIRILKLQHISAHQFRVEELSDYPDFAGQFDVVISRAFTSLNRFLEVAAPLIKPDGVIIAMKGKELEKEIDDLKSAGMSGDLHLINENLYIKFPIKASCGHTK